MTALDRIALFLVIIGALNWGLVGLLGFDLVAALAGVTFGEVNALSSIIYVVVALAGLVLLRLLLRPAVVVPRSAHPV